MLRDERKEPPISQDLETSLRSVISNLRCIIAKHELTIERLTRQLAEEKSLKYDKRVGN